MSRRIDVELTSAQDDGTWTWRAAGARQPKGVLDGALLYEGAKVGDVVRAEADFDIDGITVRSVLPPKGKRKEPERLEVVGPQREFTPVTSTLAKRERGERPRREGGGRERRPGGGPRPDGGRREGAGRPGGDRSGAAREGRDERPRRERPAPPPPRPKAKKLRPRRAHRDAFLASLPPAQHPIAEQLMKGGMPAVRTALTEQNAKAKAEGKPEVPVTAVLAIAEDLAPAVRLAEWLDRAEAAVADAEELALQDLRSVVVGAGDVIRDERASEIAEQLRAVLDRRGPAEMQLWVSDVEQSLAAGRVVRALRLAARPPQPNESLPEELAGRLAEAAGAAMTADIEPDRWGTVLDAVAYAPVRRAVVPGGVPAEPGETLLALVRKHAGRSPAIAALFGVEAPPPKESGRRSRRSGGGRSKAPDAATAAAPAPVPPARPVIGPDGRKIPPPPPRPSSPSAEAATSESAPPVPGPGEGERAEGSGAPPNGQLAPAASEEPKTGSGDEATSPAPDAPAGSDDANEPPAPQEAGAPEASEATATHADPVSATEEPGAGAPDDPVAPASTPEAPAEAATHPAGDDPRPHGDKVLAPENGPATEQGSATVQPGGDDPRPHGDPVAGPGPAAPLNQGE